MGDHSPIDKNGINPLKVAKDNWSKLRGSVLSKPKIGLNNKKFSIKVENISDCKLILSTQLKEICDKLSKYENNEEFLEFLDQSKTPYLFNSKSLLQIVNTTLSVKTKITIIQMIAPRLIDPKVMNDDFIELFRYADEKCLVEEALRLRSQQMNASVFKQNPTLSVNSGRGGAGRGVSGRGGAGRGANSGKGNIIGNENTFKTNLFNPSNLDDNKVEEEEVVVVEEENDDNDEEQEEEVVVVEEEKEEKESKNISETFETPSKLPRRRISLNMIRRCSFDENNNSNFNSLTNTSLIDDLLEIRKSISVSTLKQKLEETNSPTIRRTSESFDSTIIANDYPSPFINNRRDSRTILYDSNMNFNNVTSSIDSSITIESTVINSNRRDSIKVSFDKSPTITISSNTSSPVTLPTNIDPPQVNPPNNHISIDVPILVTPIPTIKLDNIGKPIEIINISSPLKLFKHVDNDGLFQVNDTTINTNNNYPNEIVINTVKEVKRDIKKEKDIIINNNEKDNNNVNKEVKIIKNNIKSPISSIDINKNNLNSNNNYKYNSPSPIVVHSSWNKPVEEIYYTSSVSVASLAKKIDTKTVTSPLPSNNTSFKTPSPKKIINFISNKDVDMKVNSNLISIGISNTIITDHNGLMSLSPELSIGIENNIHLFSYQELVRKNYIKSYDDVDKESLENHLNDIVFKEIFGMNKADFQTLPKWKRISKKKILLLF